MLRNLIMFRLLYKCWAIRSCQTRKSLYVVKIVTDLKISILITAKRHLFTLNIDLCFLNNCCSLHLYILQSIELQTILNVFKIKKAHHSYLT